MGDMDSINQLEDPGFPYEGRRMERKKFCSQFVFPGSISPIMKKIAPFPEGKGRLLPGHRNGNDRTLREIRQIYVTHYKQKHPYDQLPGRENRFEVRC